VSLVCQEPECQSDPSGLTHHRLSLPLREARGADCLLEAAASAAFYEASRIDVAYFRSRNPKRE